MQGRTEDKVSLKLMEADQILYAVCERNEFYPYSLELGRAYRVLPDPRSAEHGLIRVVDESSEDYLYPQERFATPRPKPRGRSVWRRLVLPFSIVLLLQRRARARARRCALGVEPADLLDD